MADPKVAEVTALVAQMNDIAKEVCKELAKRFFASPSVTADGEKMRSETMASWATVLKKESQFISGDESVTPEVGDLFAKYNAPVMKAAFHIFAIGCARAVEANDSTYDIVLIFNDVGLD